MTIKKKLYLNIVLTAATIAVIVGFSLIGMKFVRGNLTTLTERSTPYQLKTIELQRSLQEHTANLLKVSAAASGEEFDKAKIEVEKTLAEVKKAVDALSDLKGGSSSASGFGTEELSSISGSMFSTTSERIKMEIESRTADQLMHTKLSESARKLRELDGSVKKIQKASVDSLMKSSESSKGLSKKEKYVQAAAQAVKEALSGMFELQSADRTSTVAVAQNHISAAIRMISLQTSNLISVRSMELAKRLTLDSSDLNKLLTGAEGLFELKKNMVVDAVAGMAYTDRFNEKLVFVKQKLGNMAVIIQDESEKLSDAAAGEGKVLDDSLKNSTSAGDVLALNGELISLGFRIESLIGRLFIARTAEELQRLSAELKSVFDSASNVTKKLQDGLAALKRNDELKLIKNVSDSLQEIRNLNFVSGGVIDKLRRTIEVNAKAVELNIRLRDMVAKQKEEGRKGVASAQTEQEKAIGSVNRVVRFYVVGVAAAGIIAIIFGIVFSKLLERSVTCPITELGRLAAGFGSGNFAMRMDEKRKDEFGDLGRNFNHASDQLREITDRLRLMIEQLSANSGLLSITSENLLKGSSEQTSQVEQSATAMTEMSHTTLDVAKNASATSESAMKAKGLAEHGKQAMGVTVQELVKFSGTFKQAADKIEALSKQSQEISNVVSLIKEIAEQTNLLALNAAIEAAHAGQQGRGFAVVADNVRQLAERTAGATDDIGRTIQKMQTDVDDTVTFVKHEKEAVESVVRQVKGTMGEIDQIAGNVDQVADMIQRIAVATDEQSSTSDMVSHSMESVANVTRQLNVSIEEIKRSAGDLSRLATELNTMAGWFKT